MELSSWPRIFLDFFPIQSHFGGAESAGHVWQLAQHALGCRLVQLALETGCHEAALLTRELQGHVQEAAVSPHANYVIQKAPNGAPVRWPLWTETKIWTCRNSAATVEWENMELTFWSPFNIQVMNLEINGEHPRIRMICKSLKAAKMPCLSGVSG